MFIQIPKYAFRSFVNFMFFFAKPFIFLIILQIFFSFISSYIWFNLMMDILASITSYMSTNSPSIISTVLLCLKNLLIKWCIGSIAYLLSTIIQAYLYPKMEMNARLQCYDFLQKVPQSITAQHSSGYLESIITAACDSLTSNIKNIFEDILPNVILLITLSYELFQASPKLGLYTICLNIIYFTIMTIFNRKYSIPSGTKYSYYSSMRTNTVLECFNNRTLNFIYRLYDIFLNRVKQISYLEQTASIKSKLTHVVGFILREILFLFGMGYGYYRYVIYLVQIKSLSMLNSVNMFNYGRSMISLQWSMSNIFGDVIEAYGEGSLSTNLMYKWYDIVEEQAIKIKNGTQITNGISKIEFKNVSLKFNDKIIIENESFIIDNKNIIMFAGPSGCGKTTLVNMISGIITDYEGEILINDINIREYSPEALRNNITYISQGTSIIEGTIEFNVKLNNNQINTNDIISLGQELNMRNITKEAGINGGNLSGGEKQRVCIMRGLLSCQKNQLIISDELTSNLDMKNAHKALSMIIEKARQNNSILILIEHIPFAQEFIDCIYTFEWFNDRYKIISPKKII